MSEENKTPETAANPEANPEATEKPAVETPAPAAKPAAAEKPAAETPAPAEKPAAPAKPAAAAAKPAAEKAEEPPAPPDPRVVQAEERLAMIKGKIVNKFGEQVIEVAEVKKFNPTFVIKAEHWVEVVEFVKTDASLGFVYPECMAGTDYKDYIEVYLLIHSFTLDFDLVMKVRTPRDNASVPSVTGLFSGVNWEEREIYDLLGVHFEGHPDLRRIMLTDDWQGHPLRKDYVVKD